MYTNFQKFAAEFLGTFALVFFGAGSICADRYLQSSGGIGLLGIAAAFLLKAVIPEETWRAVALGTPELVRDFSRLSAMLLEAVTSFFLVLVVFATAVDDRGSFRSIAGFGIGLTITLGILVIGPFTGGAMNPARAFGPALASNHWTNWGVYWIGPLAGGFLAGLLYDSLYLKKAV